MIEWEILFEAEKKSYRNRAEEYIQKGIYQGYEIEELAIMIYTMENEKNESDT